MSSTRLDTPQIRKINREEVFHYIKRNPGITKARVGAALELSRPTVATTVSELEEAGLLLSEKALENTGGRSAMAYSVNASARLAAGIQLSPRHIRGVLVDLLGNMVGSVSRRMPFQTDEAYRKEVGSVFRQLLEESGVEEEKLEGTGVTVQALTDPEGQKVTYVPVAGAVNSSYEKLIRYIPGKCRLFHDLSALGYNQHLWRGFENVFYLSVNSSIGGTILVKNSVYEGNGNKAGEVGHLQLVQNGLPCYCGNRGCFDAYCNTMRLSDFAGGTLDDFFAGLDEGRSGYREFWEEYLDYFASAVFSLRIIFDSAIMIGGELGRYATYFLQPLRDRLDEKTFFPNERADEYLFAYEGGEFAIAAGAAMYYTENVLDSIWGED